VKKILAFADYINILKNENRGTPLFRAGIICFAVEVEYPTSKDSID
jgi:hypothetical protein